MVPMSAPGVWVYPQPALDVIVPLVLPRPGDRMSPIRESAQRQHYEASRRLSAPPPSEPAELPTDLTLGASPAVLRQVDRTPVAVPGLARLSRCRPGGDC